MRILTRSLIIGSLALIASLKTQAAVDDESPLAAQAVPLLYVANATDSGGSGPGFVSAYDPGSCGSVSPILTIRGTNTLIDDFARKTARAAGQPVVCSLAAAGRLNSSLGF